MVIGDLNLPGIDWNMGSAHGFYEKKLFQYVLKKELVQHVEEPTRIGKSRNSLIDILITKGINVIACSNYMGLGKSDHCSIKIRLQIHYTDGTIERLHWIKADYEKIISAISGYDWDQIFCSGNIDGNWLFFRNII